MKEKGILNYAHVAVNGCIKALSILTQFVRLKPLNLERINALITALEGVEQLLHEQITKK